VNRVFFIGISSFILPRKFYFHIPLRSGGLPFDYEYERNGVANLFMVFAPLEGWRHVAVRA